MKTVFVSDRNGQLGNQLFLFAHFISNALENNYRLYFPAFNDLSVYFEHPSKNRYGQYPIRSRFSKWKSINSFVFYIIRITVAILYRTIPVSRWHRIIRLYQTNDLRIDQYSFYNIEEEKDFSKKENILFLQGWSFRSPQCVLRQKNNVRPLFQLTKFWSDKVNTFINSAKKDCDLLIGVHIRRGDYKTFLKGIYFYDDNSYRNYMLQVLSLFPGKRIKFVITSNEQVVIKNIEGCSMIYPNGHFIEDLYSLAECDYLIGPPSTFSQWASCYGDKPLRILWNPTSEIQSINEFEVAVL